MKYALIITLSFIILAIAVVLALTLIVKFAKLTLKYTRLAKYLYNYLNVITSLRYGNLNTKTEDGIDALTIQLSRNTNALIESIKDRDSMINEYIEKEKESQNIKQDFIASLAHDLKIPIIAQDNTYDLLLSGSFGALSDTQKDAIQNLKISNNDLKNLIVDLLDAQKLDYKKIELNLENTSLNNLIKETIEQNKSLLKMRNKNILFQSINEDITYPIDTFLFKRVLNNLISNAVFYGKNSQNIYITLDKHDGFVEISVIDEGDGINEEDINHIFTKYYTSAKKYSNIGAGLGLYIANKIILAHSGRICAKNNSQKGACFTIYLPLTF